MATVTQRFRKAADLRRLAGTLTAFECNEQSRTGRQQHFPVFPTCRRQNVGSASIYLSEDAPGRNLAVSRQLRLPR
jgi:hypothetical protein